MKLPCLPRIVLGALLLALQSHGFSAEQETKPRIVLGPSLTVPADSGGNGELFVWWNVDQEVDGHRVEYGLTPQLGQVASLEAKTRFPNIRLQELQPGKRYYYRVATGDCLGDVFEFELPDPAGPLRFVFWADNQHGYEVFEKQTVPLAQKLKPNFLLVPGDTVELGFLYRDWSRDLYGPAAPLLRTIPWYPVRGNHDGIFSLALEMLPLPDSNHWYARTYGKLRIVALDTNTDYNPGSPQVKWLREEIAGAAWKDATFRIVSFHQPPFNWIQNRSNDDGTREVRDVLVPILEEGGTDLVVCGHAHVYERGKRSRPDGGSTTYLTCGGGGGRLDSVRAGNWPHITVSVQKHHVVVADLEKETMKFQAIESESETPIDAFTLTGGSLATTQLSGKARD